ncbi:MAG: hypothetical protein ABIS38_08505 [Sphingomicrobium sp.]
MRMILLAASLVLSATPAAPALAGASPFTLVNGTSNGLSEVSIRRAGTADWKPLGAPGKVSFTDPDCAFDIRATVAGSGPVTWTGINLCDVKSVTLKRDEKAGAWVDYDE